MTDDDVVLIKGMAYSFGKAVTRALATRDDLLEGFAAGRYSFVVSIDNLAVLTAPPVDLHAELEANR